MSELKSIPNTELSEYAVSILIKHGIHTVTDLIKTSLDRLMKILNLNEEQIFQIITTIENIYGGFKINLKQQHDLCKMHSTIYKTGIIPLDNMLECETLRNGAIWELTGTPGVGKTQLSLTLLINFVINTDFDVLYIDTKMDFSSQRVLQMLKRKGFKCMEKCFNIMQRIKVERCVSPTALLQILHNLELALERRQTFVSKIKLIIVDSLPAIWYLLKNDKLIDNQSIGKIYQIQLDQILHKLAQRYFMAIVVINLSLNIMNLTEKNPLSSCKKAMQNDIVMASGKIDSTEDLTLQEKYVTQYKQSLGVYWQLVPRLRLSLEYSEEDTGVTESLRIIKVVDSCYIDNTKSCKVHLIEEGVV